jgi:hypothetical protein
MNMKTSLLTLGAVGVLAAGVAIHHSGHCPLMEARKALVHHSAPAVSPAGSPAASGVLVAKTASAVKPDAVVAVDKEGR